MGYLGKTACEAIQNGAVGVNLLLVGTSRGVVLRDGEEVRKGEREEGREGGREGWREGGGREGSREGGMEG